MLRHTPPSIPINSTVWKSRKTDCGKKVTFLDGVSNGKKAYGHCDREGLVHSGRNAATTKRKWSFNSTASTR